MCRFDRYIILGASNLVGSSIVGTGAIPVFGSITRQSLSPLHPLLFKGCRLIQLRIFSGSRLNGQIGSRTQMASIITSICMIFSIFFLLPYLYYLPKVRLFFLSVPNQNVLVFSR